MELSGPNHSVSKASMFCKGLQEGVFSNGIIVYKVSLWDLEIPIDHGLRMSGANGKVPV